MNDYIRSKKEDLQKTISFFRAEISSIRTGRANPNLLEGVQVEAYGVKSPVNAVASISVADAQSMTISPWDKGAIKDIERSLIEADLGISIVNEGSQIRLVVPKMTEENRKELVKKLNEKHEAARVRARQVRDDIKQAIEQAEKDKDISEDDKFRFLKEMDEEIGRLNDELKSLRDKKEEDIMTI